MDFAVSLVFNAFSVRSANFPLLRDGFVSISDPLTILMESKCLNVLMSGALITLQSLDILSSLRLAIFSCDILRSPLKVALSTWMSPVIIWVSSVPVVLIRSHNFTSLMAFKSTFSEKSPKQRMSGKMSWTRTDKTYRRINLGTWMFQWCSDLPRPVKYLKNTADDHWICRTKHQNRRVNSESFYVQ